jgi:hypothetical protein
MADWLPHFEWLSCPTPAIAAAVAARLASIDRFPWPDDRWAARVARIGRGALYQVEGIQPWGYSPLASWIEAAAPGVRALDGFNYLVPRAGTLVDLAAAAEVLGGAVADLGPDRALCLAAAITPAIAEHRWPDLAQTERSRAPLARVLEALLLASRGPHTTLELGLRTAAHGCVHTGQLSLRIMRGGDAWLGGDAALDVTGEHNPLRNAVTYGPSVWALRAAPAGTSRPDDHWPFGDATLARR